MYWYINTYHQITVCERSALRCVSGTLITWRSTIDLPIQLGRVSSNFFACHSFCVADWPMANAECALPPPILWRCPEITDHLNFVPALQNGAFVAGPGNSVVISFLFCSDFISLFFCSLLLLRSVSHWLKSHSHGTASKSKHKLKICCSKEEHFSEF